MENMGMSTTLSAWQSKVAPAGQAAQQGQPPLIRLDAPAPEASVIYHPGSEDPVDRGDFDVYQKTGRPASNYAIRAEPVVLAELGAVQISLASAYTDFQKALAATDPDLVEKNFGFSVSQNGHLVAVNAGSLSQDQIQRLETALNASSRLVKAANSFARLSMEFVAASAVYEYGKFHLDLDNYASTIDLGRALGVGAQSGQDRFNGQWDIQLWRNGEKRYDGWEKLVDGQWVDAPEYQPQSVVAYR
ncbi:hypothetical protein DNK34_16725 [Pseudomonas dryadis]|uniref:Uncharacterized protein n=2 Tax=Pseudomonadales TaxID=72274 RepID=A0ABY1Z741_9GAMM|nr:hypothetical protein DNK34_16725 [Pseudomonas dryadis]TBV16392.1 hypothetical protein DNK41_16040 [Pseudomonas sp. FRB 230]